MGGDECFTQPTTTAELVRRLEELDLNPDLDPTTRRQHESTDQEPASGSPLSLQVKRREAAALGVLSQSMVKLFYGDPKRSYIAEAVALSAFTSLDRYQDLFNGFVRALADDTGDCDIPDIKVLACFNAMLHCPQAERVGPDLPLGYAMINLTKRLTAASLTADDHIRYQLLCTLSSVLDAMNEVKAGGVIDAAIIQPLVKMLEDASEHSELRLSQAARYAGQALRGILSEVSPWKQLGKSVYKTPKASATLAGSVTSLDPAELLDAFEGLGEAVDLVEAVSDIIDDFSPKFDAFASFKSAISGTHQETKSLARPAQWYIALRYTDMFVRGNRPGLLDSMLNNPDFSLQQDENFLCGLCAQLEQAINDDGKGSLTVFVLTQFLNQQSSISRSRRVAEWVRMTVPTTKIGTSTKSPQRKIRRIILLKLSNILSIRTYSTAVGYQKPLPETPGGELLNKAWQTCNEAKLFYADRVIRNHYTDKALGKLNIERLGRGNILSMDQCYINLTISQGATKATGEDPPLSFRRGLATWEPKESNRVNLSDIFHSKSNTMRVLIRGQAGVGKSTLCKKIVYDVIYHDMWTGIIDRVIWLPLRHLKGLHKSRYKYNLRSLLDMWYFKGQRDGDKLLDALYAAFEADKSRTLFILDGLDEVLQELSSDGPNLLQVLLDQPRVIITTRPYAFDRNRITRIDRELETIGFYRDQMKQYIEAVAPEKAVEMQDFLRSHPVIEGLARIPIQLDAFCHSFEAGAFQAGSGPKSMTELYSAIDYVIWKDVVQLEKRRHGNLQPISQSDAWRWEPSEVERMVQGEANALQALGFAGLLSNVQEFDSKYQEKLLEEKDTLTQHLPGSTDWAWGEVLDKLPFLRTSDGGAALNRSYHFLHLTYQEYFAARFIVHHWPDRQLPRVGLSAQAFFHQEKYNPRYDVVWRFVAGLLHAQGSTDFL